MSVFVALTLSFIVACSAVKVNIDNTGPLTIQKGFSQVITFSLDSPIICEDPHVFCGVTVLLINPDTKSLTINTCQVKWNNTNWFVPVQITVKAAETFVDDGEKMFTIGTKAVISNSEYYKGFDPKDIVIRTMSRPTRTCAATGDPHYTGFDGKYWDYYATGQQVFYKSTVRDFEVQTRTYISSVWSVSTHCAIAARENNDIVYFSIWDGIRVSFSSPEGQRPTVQISGNSYYVNFKSGAQVSWYHGGFYMNVYATAPGIDYGKTVGMCGNNNGNPNDDIPGSGFYSESQLFPSMRVTPQTDLWSWKPTNSPVTTTTSPPFAQECAYTDPVVSRPVISYGNAEDITKLLQAVVPVGTPQPLSAFQFNDTVVEVPTEKPFNVTDATITCTNAIKNTNLGKACAQFPSINLQTYVDNCVIDLQLTLGNQVFVNDAVSALQSDCASIAGTDPSTWVEISPGVFGPNPNITNNLCPNSCSGHGTCSMATCICTAPFTGVDCSHDSSSPASITSISPSGCDYEDPRGCPSVIQISGSNFIAGTGATCRFGSILTNLTYLSPTLVQCSTPANPNADPTSLYTFSVSVSNDGVAFSSETIKYVFYDSVCHVCGTNGLCTSNPSSCVISQSCYRNGAINAGNPCQTCVPSKSTSAWTYSYGDSYTCSPVFDTTTYTAQITDNTPTNSPVITVHASNQFATGDASYKITYSLGLGSNAAFYHVNPTTGEISTSQAINPAQVNLMTYSALVVVVATDSANNTNSANVFIRLQGTDLPPVFNQSTYTFTVAERSAIGTRVGSVFATDPNVGQSGANPLWSVFTYDWVLQEANFGGVFNVDNVTGLITVAKPIYYAQKSSYYLGVRAIDGGGEYGSAVVNINIREVFAAPTGVSISSSSVNENALPSTVVGVLSATGLATGDSATFTLLTPNVPFAISGKNLIVTQFPSTLVAPTSFNLTINATESIGLSSQANLTIFVNYVNRPPTNVSLMSASSQVLISGATLVVPENFAVQSVLAIASAVDPNPNEAVMCVVSSSSLFQIANNQLVLVAPLSYANAPFVSFKVACADNGSPSLSTSFVTYNVNVTYVNKGGQGVSLQSSLNPVPEDSNAGVVVGTVSAIDSDPQATSIEFSTASSDHFQISGPATCVAYGTKGAVKCSAPLAVRGGLNFVTTPVEIVHIQMQDNNGFKSAGTVSVSMSAAPRPPTGVELTSNHVSEASKNGDVVGTLIIHDERPPTTPYSVSLSNPAGGRFKLQSVTRRDTTVGYQLVVADASKLNAVATPQVTVSFRVIVAGMFDNTFDYTVIIDHRPIVIVLPATSISKDWPTNNIFATVSLTGLTDPAASANFQLVAGNTGVFGLSTVTSTTASLSLAQSLVSFTDTWIAITIAVSFSTTNAPIPMIMQTFNLSVTPVHTSPVFQAFPDPVPVNIDVTKNTVLLNAVASGTGSLTYSIANVSPVCAGFFSVAASTGAISAAFVPSANLIPTGSCSLDITASDGIKQTTKTLNFEIRDNCYVAPGGSPLCLNGGTCANAFKSAVCVCPAPFTGSDCTSIIPSSTVTTAGPVLNSASSGVSQGATAGIAIAVIVAILVLLAVVVLVVLRRKQAKNSKGINEVDAEGQVAVFNNGFMKEDTYDAPIHPAVDTDFEPGVTNPMYAWYQPQMSRQECEDYLGKQGEGAFVVRDSSFTPGWHMLAVKTSNSIVHERIKLHADGTYEMLPSTNASQPAFRGIPDLVDHYAVCKRQGVGFSLALDNPIYDNHLLQEAPRTIKPLDTIHEADAPIVPMRDSERENVAQLAEGGPRAVHQHRRSQGDYHSLLRSQRA